MARLSLKFATRGISFEVCVRVHFTKTSDVYGVRGFLLLIKRNLCLFN
ncbi:hypothetical protein LMQOC2_20103 [Listeria monocytogenes QOC2]|nr:hypothetical protein LMQOC2_20103 [Listeria monocytogenes QOC2]